MMNTQDLLYQQITALCESFKELRKEVTELNLKFNDFEHSRKFKNKAYSWVGAAVVALISTDAFLDLITNHIRL